MRVHRFWPRQGGRPAALVIATLLTSLLTVAASSQTAAQDWTQEAQEILAGHRHGLRPVDSGLRLPTPRYGMPAVVLGESIFVIGGQGKGSFQGEVVQVNPASRTVTTVSKALLPRRYHAAAAVGRFLYVFGGVTPSDGPKNITNIVERFNTETGEVTLLAPMPTPLRLPGAVAVGSKIYVIGGSDRTGEHVGTVAIYDTRTDAWTEGAPMPAARECAFVVRNGSIYAVGGFNGEKAMTDFDVYSIAKNTWTTLPPIPFTLSAHHVTLLNDRIYAFGDYNVPERGAVYDFEERRWGPLQDAGFVGSRNNPVVALNGTLYVLGGNINAEGTTLDLIQSFVPRF
ncbi:MAG: hypothetical protein H7Z41_12775 [Cytophagales bacterium]|nr:hypothetical protein [Armatimonadota bacterium]